MSPLIPTPTEMFVLFAGFLTVILWAIAIFSLARDRYYTSSDRLLWLLLVLVAPVIGSALWLLIGRRSRLRAGRVRAASSRAS